MSDSVALKGCALAKRFGTSVALDRVDIIANRGSVHGLLGPNGAGKTTLLRTLLGLVRPDSGSVTLLGHLRDVGRAEPLPDGVAGVIDGAGFYPYLTGRTNLSLFARLDAPASTSMKSRVDRALDRTGFTRDADRLVGSYSAGMKQRLALAAALLRTPRLLILDEPTSALDPGAARDMRELFRELAAAGIAILLSSHDMVEVDALCDTLTVMNHGRVIFAGTAAELRRLASAPVHTLRTSDDDAALGLASNRHAVHVNGLPEGGLQVSASLDALDPYIVALGRAGIAVRALESRAPSLESLFLEITNQRGGMHAGWEAGAAALERAAS